MPDIWHWLKCRNPKWSRAFYDPEADEDYVVCLNCGRRERSLSQFGPHGAAKPEQEKTLCVEG